MMNGDDKHSHHFKIQYWCWQRSECTWYSIYTYYTACTENHDDAYKIKHKFKNKECIAVTVSVKKEWCTIPLISNNYTVTTIKTHLFTFQIKLNCWLQPPPPPPPRMVECNIFMLSKTKQKSIHRNHLIKGCKGVAGMGAGGGGGGG